MTPSIQNLMGQEPGADHPAGDRDLEIHVNGSRFGELQLRKQLIARGPLLEAILAQTTGGKRLGTLLVEAGAISDRQLAEALAEHLNLALADLRTDRPDKAAVDLLPEHLARELVAVPMRFDGDTLEIVVADPTPDATRLLGQATARDVRLLVGPASEIRRVIDITYRALGAIDTQVTAFSLGDKAKRSAASVPLPQAGPAGADAPVIQVVNLLIAGAARPGLRHPHRAPGQPAAALSFSTPVGWYLPWGVADRRTRRWNRPACRLRLPRCHGFVVAWVDPKGGSDMFRVLICDDDAGIRTFLRAVLEDGGAAVEETADGDECVEAVRRRRPDLLILDFMMPKRDGISALAEIGPEFPDLPVLMVSAYLEDVRDVAEAMGARCFLKSDFLEHAADLLAEFTGIAPIARTELV